MKIRNLLFIFFILCSLQVAFTDEKPAESLKQEIQTENQAQKRWKELEGYMSEPEKPFNSQKFVGKDVLIQGFFIEAVEGNLLMGTNEVVQVMIIFKQPFPGLFCDTMVLKVHGKVLGIKPEKYAKSK